MKQHRRDKPAKTYRPTRLVMTSAALVMGAALLFAACSSGGETASSPAASAGGPAAGASAASCPPAGAASGLTGAGSTFVFPLMSKWVDQYKNACHVTVNYQAIGSGGGIKGLTDKTLDFGASDAIMSADQESAASQAGGPVRHIPDTLGAVPVIYNLPGIDSGKLKLSGPVLANIYLKNIKKWDDPQIKALNPGLDLPDASIAVVHRSDGSGTTFIFTNYLSKVSPEWKDKVGSATSVKWPGDIGGDGSEGVTAQVQQTPGAIGYAELAYAVQNNLPWAALQNAGGKFVQPGLDSASAAATGVSLPDDMKVMVTDSANADAYPISGFSWLLVYKEQPDKAKGQAMAAFLWWAVHDGQQFSKDLTYAPLSKDAVTKAEAEIRSMTYQGQPLLGQ